MQGALHLSLLGELRSTNARPPLTWRELALSFFVALTLFAWPLRAGLFDPSRILFGVDTACAQRPWSAAPDGSDQVANPELADQGMVFYPAYRFVAREWGSGGPPLWNPLIYAGAPAIGNPQLGVLDPQVLLQVLIGKLFGPAAFDWSFAFLIWMRLAFAASGAFALARRLGLGAQGATLAAVGFSSAGFVALWANHSLGHVAPFLPWCLFALEGLRGARPARAFVAASLLFAAAILGGHPETAFNVGLACGLWSLALWRDQRRTGVAAIAALACGTLLAAPSLAPFVEYLQSSGAMIARQLLAPPREPDWIALGLCAVAIGIVWRWRELSAQRTNSAGRATSFGVGLLLAVCLTMIFSRQATESARLFLWPDALGGPAEFRGGGQFLEQASAWIAAPIAILALAACLTSPRAEAPGMTRRTTCMLLGLGALLLALHAPGVLDLYRQLPLIGLAATVRFALVSALCLSLLAGEALERANLSSRLAAVGTLGLLAILALRHAPLEALDDNLRSSDPNDGVVEFSERPGREISAEAGLSGWIHPGLTVQGAELAVERVGSASDDDVPRSVPVELSRTPGINTSPGPADATYFRASRLWLEHLPEGHWRFTLRLLDASGKLLGERVVSTSSLEREVSASTRSIVYWLLAALFVIGLSPGIPAWCLILFAALQGLGFLAQIHPAIERTRVFPLTQTETILARELGSRRYFAEPGVLPANTGMIRGLRAIDGYDGLDPASFDGYRSAVLRPGAQPLLGFSARNAQLDSPAFRLLGVGALVLAAPIDAPGFELIASPDATAPERAECWIYRAIDPLPRAFCVSRTVTRESVLADLAHFDPLQAAFLEDGGKFETATPFQHADVGAIAWHNDAVELEVKLDGAGLLILTEQHFPGWHVSVDGVDRPLLRADSIFRAVALETGAHRVVFRYAPRSWTLGLWLAALGLLSVVIGSWRIARWKLLAP